MSTLRRFVALPRSHQLAAVEVALILVGVRLSLKLAGLHATLEALRRAPRRRRGEIPPRDLARLVRAIGHRMMGHPCLTEALALKLLLDRDAQPSRLVIGARRTARDGLTVHAWLEREGEVLIGEPLEGLDPLFER